MVRRAKTPYSRVHGYATSSCCPPISSVVVKILDADRLHQPITNKASSMPITPLNKHTNYLCYALIKLFHKTNLLILTVALKCWKYRTTGRIGRKHPSEFSKYYFDIRIIANSMCTYIYMWILEINMWKYNCGCRYSL